MARIPEEEIERLKSQISLERLAVAKGIQLKKHGENLLGLCPFHDDRETSLVITPSKNLWHCLGACQTGGTVIDWVMRAEGVSFRELPRNSKTPGEEGILGERSWKRRTNRSGRSTQNSSSLRQCAFWRPEASAPSRTLLRA